MIHSLITSSKSFLIIFHFFIIFHKLSFVNSGYCDLQSCGGNPHTMCKYPENGPSSNCAQYETSPLTNSDKNSIVNRHNKLRKKVADGSEKRGKPGPQPKALEMPNLVWDDELATVAQRWADQCISGHDKCRNVDRFKVGQNIATAWSTAKIKKKIENLVDDWYDEVKYFSRYYVDSYRFGMSWGHYSQVVWAKTLTVGCGRVLFFDNSKRMNTLRLVCNYGPTGNFVNEPVYPSSGFKNNFNIFYIIHFILINFYFQI